MSKDNEDKMTVPLEEWNKLNVKLNHYQLKHNAKVTDAAMNMHQKGFNIYSVIGQDAVRWWIDNYEKQVKVLLDYIAKDPNYCMYEEKAFRSEIKALYKEAGIDREFLEKTIALNY